MPEDVTTDQNETPYPDAEDWQIAFEPFAGHPQAALQLGFHLTELKRLIDSLKSIKLLRQSTEQLTASMSTQTFAV